MFSIKDGQDNKAFNCQEQDFNQNHPHQTNISLDDKEEDTAILKTGNKLLRWNLAFSILLLMIIPLPLWLPFVSLELSTSLLPVIQIIFMASWLTVTSLSWITYFKLWAAKEKIFPRNESLNHLIVLSTYKEPLSLLITTVESMEIQETAAANINLTISFEARTPDLDAKMKTLEERFTAKFRRLYLTVHPFGLPGEIPGKCSNANYGIRASLSHLEQCGLDTDNLVITTCDADTKFHPQFFNALTEQYLAAKDPHQCLYQSPLLYNWRLDEASVVTSYQMDDIIALIRWMGVAGRRLAIVLVPVPTLSGPTSGRVLEQELGEWAAQARRWTIGAAEVFHYFMVKSPRIPLLTAISWGASFTFYYAVLLCCSHLYGLTLAASHALLLPSDATFFGTSFPLSCLLVHMSLAVLYFNAVSMFLLDKLSQRLLVPRPREQISLVRDAFHLLVSPLVILAYSIVEFWSIMEFAVRGREICRHVPSQKCELGVNTGAAGELVKAIRKASLCPSEKGEQHGGGRGAGEGHSEG